MPIAFPPTLALATSTYTVSTATLELSSNKVEEVFGRFSVFLFNNSYEDFRFIAVNIGNV